MPEWKTVPDEPGLWLKAYRGYVQGVVEEFVTSDKGLEWRRIPGHLIEALDEFTTWYGPIPKPECPNA